MTAFDPLRADTPLREPLREPLRTPRGTSLIVYIDFKSPYAYIAKDPTYAMLDDLGIDADWRPITLDIPSYLGSARLDAQGKVAESNRTKEQWSGVRYAYADARRYAKLRGLTLRGTVKIWDSSLAHIGMMWAKQQSQRVLRDYIGRVYEPFWKRELDIEDPAVISRVLHEAGADVAGFDDFRHGPGRAQHDAMQAAIFDAGIFGVPSYVVNGELFFGREHLPMVRWLLSGQHGAAPDVAYENVPGTAGR